MKGSKRKTVNGQIFGRAANLEPEQSDAAKTQHNIIKSLKSSNEFSQKEP